MSVDSNEFTIKYISYAKITGQSEISDGSRNRLYLWEVDVLYGDKVKGKIRGRIMSETSDGSKKRWYPAMWRKLVAEHEFGDVASLALLKTALESHQRSRLSREQIDQEGRCSRRNVMRAQVSLAH